MHVELKRYEETYPVLRNNRRAEFLNLSEIRQKIVFNIIYIIYLKYVLKLVKLSKVEFRTEDCTAGKKLWY